MAGIRSREHVVKRVGAMNGEGLASDLVSRADSAAIGYRKPIANFRFFRFTLWAMTTLLEQTVLPDTDGGDVQQLDALLAVLTADHSVIVRAGESSAQLPEELRQILTTVLSNLIQGTAVTVEPHRTLLTTQEAADILGITRPTLVRLLTDNEIPYTTPGRHRRVQLTDVLAYQQRTRTQRAEALAELAAPDPRPTETDGFIATR